MAELDEPHLDGFWKDADVQVDQEFGYKITFVAAADTLHTLNRRLLCQ